LHATPVQASTAAGELFSSNAFCSGRHLPRASFHRITRDISACVIFLAARMFAATVPDR
jgi:hypothetical protein